MKLFANSFRLSYRFLKARRSAVLFLLSLVIAGVLHGYNMFHYPYFESDEGTYLSQAYAVHQIGELSHYVYWYDHPPFGWITIAAWMDLLQGDWNFFGSALNSGRVLMWLLHMAQVSIIFFLVQRVTASPWLGFFTILLYSVPPLNVYFQRRVLLDNLMVTWVLLSTAMLFVREMKLRYIMASGVFYGLAVVTKVTSVMFGPALLYLILVSQWNLHRGFRAMSWLVVSISIVCTWILYALIKTEFFLSDDRVSLLGALKFQSERGTGAYFWERDSSFMDNVINGWMILDTTSVFILLGAVVASVLIAIFKREYRFFAFATLLYAFFLIRGGVVIGFYILPLLPFAFITLACFLKVVKTDLLDRLRVPASVSACAFVLLLVAFSYHYSPKAYKYLSVDETNNQIEALRWIKRNLPEEAAILSDVYGMTELLDPTFENNKVFTNADWYFKVAKDPAIRFDKYRDDWRNFDYVFISHEMLYQSSINNLPVVQDAIKNSEPLIRFDANTTSFIDVQKFISTNGDWAAVHRVNNNTRTQLLYAWNYYRDNFIESYGQVVDPQTGVTTSEGQAYAMLRAALMNDRETFNGLWLWTQHNFQHRLGDQLLSWKWEDGQQTDSANATDADLDAALALIFASQIFEEEQYLDDARDIIEDIWTETVVTINGVHYLLPAEKSLMGRGEVYLLNPSYFSPAHYRLFAEIDEERSDEWLKLADDTYRTLNRLRVWNGNTTGLPPNWLAINQTTGSLSSASPYIAQGGADDFGYDAFRTLWRVALDVSWYDSQAGEAYLNAISPFFEREWQNRRSFADIYTLNGVRARNNQNLAVTAGILSALVVSAPPQLSSDVYNTLFVSKLVIDVEAETAYWGSPDQYYESNWVWLGLALFNENLPNLWEFYRPSE